MTIKRVTVTSPKQLRTTLTNLKSETAPVYILFNTKAEENEPEKSEIEKFVELMTYGTQDVETVIEDYLAFIPESRTINYICCYLKPDMWGPGSQLCADRMFRLLKVPTLLRLNGPQRLEMGEITRFPLLSMLFEEDKVPPPVVNQKT